MLGEEALQVGLARVVVEVAAEHRPHCISPPSVPNPPHSGPSGTGTPEAAGGAAGVGGASEGEGEGGQR